MQAADDLGRVLEWADVGERALGVDELRRLSVHAGITDDVLFDDFVDAILATCAPVWEGDPTPRDELGLRIGNWQIDLAESAVRTALLTAFIAAVLIPHGLTEFTVGFVTAVLPTVLDIERVQLTAGDQRLLVELRLKREVRERRLSEDELYDALPDATRATINRYDFADFIERLHSVDEIETDADGLIRIWP